jgi:PAS domain-containing protein
MTQSPTLGSAETSQPRIYGTGEMAERTRSSDWKNTTLGPIEHWPDILIVTLNTLLASRQPMFLWWGEEFLQFYNDAHRAYIGADRHPSALGQRGPDCWPEVWSVVGPIVDGIMRGGDSIWREDQLVPTYRDGKLEDIYWTYSYSPVRDIAGDIRGTLVVTSETTGRVLAERRLNDMLAAATDGVLSIDRDWTITDLNPKGRILLAPSGELIGRNFWEAFPETAHADSIYGKTYRAAMKDRLPGDFEAFYPEPFNAWFHVNVRPTMDGITLFFSDISDRKRAEDAVRTERARLLEVLQQAPAFFALLKGPDHIISMVNALYLRLINHRDVLGKPLRIALPDAAAQGYIDILDRVYAGERFIGYESPYQVYGEDGGPRTSASSISFISLFARATATSPASSSLVST